MPIERIRGCSTFEPANLRNVEFDERGRPRTSGWSRDNADALPRARRGKATPPEK